MTVYVVVVVVVVAARSYLRHSTGTIYPMLLANKRMNASGRVQSFPKLRAPGKATRRVAVQFLGLEDPCPAATFLVNHGLYSSLVLCRTRRFVRCPFYTKSS